MEELGKSLEFVALYQGEETDAPQPLVKTDQTVCRPTEKKYPVALILLPPWGVEFPPLGLAYLATNLKNQGWPVHVFDCRHGKTA